MYPAGNVLNKIRIQGVSIGGGGGVSDGHRWYNLLLHKDACIYTCVSYLKGSYIS